MRQKHFLWMLLVTLGVLLAVVLMALSWGTYQISILDIIKTFFGNGSKLQHATIFSIRLPRILTAIVIGWAFSLAGALFQTATKNDLADSSILGVNAGAALAVVICITSRVEYYYSSMNTSTVFMIPLIAMVGGILAAILIYVLAIKNREIQPQRLLLVGIGVNIGLNALVSFIHLQSNAGDYNRVLVWTMGSLWGSNWSHFQIIAIIVMLLSLVVYYHHKTLDIINLGDETAIGLGVQVSKERKKILILAVLLASCATAFAGNIGFLGLLSPHIARKLVGPAHRRFLPISASIGSIIIVFADSFSRNIFSPIEIPVGITIALVGVPYFIYLMLKEGK